MFSLFRRCGKDKISFDIVAKNGNNVEATFDFVEKIVRLVAFDNVALTLLMVWTGLYSQNYSVTSLSGRTQTRATALPHAQSVAHKGGRSM